MSISNLLQIRKKELSLQTYTRHDKPKTDKHQTKQILDMIKIRHNTRHNQRLLCVGFVTSYASHVQGLSWLVFACLRFVVSSVCLSRVCNGTSRSMPQRSNNDFKEKHPYSCVGTLVSMGLLISWQKTAVFYNPAFLQYKKRDIMT